MRVTMTPKELVEKYANHIEGLMRRYDEFNVMDIYSKLDGKVTIPTIRRVMDALVKNDVFVRSGNNYRRK